MQWCRVDQWIPEVFDKRNIQELYRHVIQKVITNKDVVYFFLYNITRYFLTEKEHVLELDVTFCQTTYVLISVKTYMEYKDVVFMSDSKK